MSMVSDPPLPGRAYALLDGQGFCDIAEDKRGILHHPGDHGDVSQAQKALAESLGHVHAHDLAKVRLAQLARKQSAAALHALLGEQIEDVKAPARGAEKGDERAQRAGQGADKLSGRQQRSGEHEKRRAQEHLHEPRPQSRPPSPKHMLAVRKVHQRFLLRQKARRLLQWSAPKKTA
jgi:hypothetical protein